MTEVDTILIGFSTNSDGNDILIVARKFQNGNPDIINAIEGEDARDIYNKLIGGE